MWQPIETAPDNQDVLVYCPDASEEARIMICHFFLGDWHEQNPSIGAPLDVEPSHWMPLPSLPGGNI